MASNDWFEKDFYKTLGVDKNISDADLKKTYRKLARKYHPDSNPGDTAAETKFKEISEAYAVLNDKDQRAEYDQIRAMGGGARFQAPSSGSGGGYGSSAGFEDIFGSFNRGARSSRSTQGPDLSDIFSMFNQDPSADFDARYTRQRGPQKGQDTRATTTLDFATAVKGETITLTVDGSPVKVKIPAGVKDGQKIRLRGKGRPSASGGENGDLVIEVSVRKHPVFTRDGLNLRVTVPVTFTEAALGATIEVPTLGGDPVKLKVAAGTPSGRVLRVKGRGVETTKGTGDLLAEIQVVVPSHLDAEAKEALEKFAAAEPTENPRADLLAKARA